MNCNLNIYQSDDEDDNVWKVSSEAKAGNSINPASPRGEQGKGGFSPLGEVQLRRRGILGAESRQGLPQWEGLD